MTDKNIKKSEVIELLKSKGCRMTHQRKVLIDVIFDRPYANCKEIIYEANKRDSNIGKATVYRLLTTLEDLGIISRESIHQVENNSDNESYISVKLDNGNVVTINDNQLNVILEKALKERGYDNKIVSLCKDRL